MSLPRPGDAPLPARELVAPTADGLEPLRVHAGGLAWHGPRLYVAATRRASGSATSTTSSRGPEGYLLPVRLPAGAAREARFRFSFVGLDERERPPRLVVGEYGNRRETRRLAHVALCRAAGRGGGLLDRDATRGPRAPRAWPRRWHCPTASHGPWKPGSVWSGPAGRLREHRRAPPMGPEDLAYDPETDRLWTVTEHPRRALDAAVVGG